MSGFDIRNTIVDQTDLLLRLFVVPHLHTILLSLLTKKHDRTMFSQLQISPPPPLPPSWWPYTVLIPISQPPIPKLQFRNIPEGKGKIFTLSDPTSLFGTRNCHSCVGLFFPLPSKARAYVAHINAWVLSQSPAGGKEVYDRIATASEGAQTKSIIHSKLQSLFTRHNWSTSDVALSEILLICPGLNAGGSWKYSTGYYVVAAIKEFLGRPSGLRCEEGCHGFVYDFEEGEPKELSDVDFQQTWFRSQTWKQKIDGEMAQLMAVDEVDWLDEWEVEVVRES